MEEQFKKVFEIENRTKYFIKILIFLLITSIATFVFFILENKTKDNINLSSTRVNKKKDVFENLELKARGVMVWDSLNNREIFSKNADIPLPLASLTKVMTAVVSKSLIPKYGDLEIKEEYLKPEGDSGFIVKEKWDIEDLRDFTLLTSSNDGALALASIHYIGEAKSENQFIQEMNKMAKKIGLKNSKFFNEHGLDRGEGAGGAYGSARDMAILFSYTIKNYPNLLEATRYGDLEFKSDEKKYNAHNTNIYINEIPTILASKTGFTDLAGGNLVTAFSAGLNRPIIISILGSTEEDRFKDTLKLVEASLAHIRQN